MNITEKSCSKGELTILEVGHSFKYGVIKGLIEKEEVILEFKSQFKKET